MSPSDLQEQQEFQTRAMRSMGQLHAILRLMELPVEPMKDAEIMELVLTRERKIKAIAAAADGLCSAAIPNFENGGLTSHVQTNHLNALRALL